LIVIVVVDVVVSETRLVVVVVMLNGSVRKVVLKTVSVMPDVVVEFTASV